MAGVLIGLCGLSLRCVRIERGAYIAWAVFICMYAFKFADPFVDPLSEAIGIDGTVNRTVPARQKPNQTPSNC